MRLLPAGLLAAGVILGVVLPLTGAGRLPFLIGVACIAAAGLATRRTPLALAGIAAAVLLLLLPGFVNGRRNDEGIAWVAPEGERVVFAEAGLAVTQRDQGFDVTGRDIDTGAFRWRHEFAHADTPVGQGEVTRVGKTLLVDDRGGKLHALDLATGKQRWETPAADSTIAAVATPELVAMSVNDGDWRVEVRSIADGRLRWRAPTSGRSPWLGSPPIAQAFDTDRSLWPASAVVLETGTVDHPRFEVRPLATGKVVARAAGRNQALSVVGNLFLRQAEDGAMTAIDVTTGREVWTRPPNQGIAARAPDSALMWLGIPDGSLLLTGALRDLDDLSIGDELRVLDPRTGKMTVRPTHVLGASGAVVVPVDGPAITATTAGAGPTPRTPVIEDWAGDSILADGRRYKADIARRAVAATTTEVGWQQLVPQLAGRDRLGAVVRDRRSGKRLARYARHRDLEVYLHSEGERLVIHADGRDRVVKP
jgi:outer membrane protein assembly factor BamB